VQTIVLEVSGGVVQQVYTDASKMRVMIVNWDAGESPGDAFEGGEIPAEPLSAMPADTRVAFSHLLLEHAREN
jgi:hypothetical protein